jgi:uncharacterized protein
MRRSLGRASITAAIVLGDRDFRPAGWLLDQDHGHFLARNAGHTMAVTARREEPETRGVTVTGYLPPVDDGPTDRRGLRVLDLEECVARVGRHTVGRVAFASDGDLTILPVTYLPDGLGVSFLTTWGSKLQVAADGGRMAFEIDESDSSTRTGWSVLFQGSATLVDDPARLSELDARLGGSWVPAATPTFWVHLRPDSVSGREISTEP